MNLSVYFGLCYFSAFVMILMGILAILRFKKMNKVTKRNIVLSLGPPVIGCGLIISIRFHIYGGMALVVAGTVLFLFGAIPESYRMYKTYKKL